MRSQRTGNGVIEFNSLKRPVDYLLHTFTYLRMKGIPCYKHQNAGIYRDGRYIPSHTRGVYDIIGCLPKTGRLLAIEVKRPGEKPTAEQQQFIDMINEASGLAFVARSIEGVETSSK